MCPMGVLMVLVTAMVGVYPWKGIQGVARPGFRDDVSRQLNGVESASLGGRGVASPCI